MDGESLKTEQLTEQLVEVVKKHWVYLVRPFLFYVLGWAVSMGILFFSEALFVSQPVLSIVFVMLSVLCLLVSHHAFFFYVLSREASTIVITDKQILMFEYLPLIKKDLSLAVISNIDEIEEKQEGIIQNIFHYGSVIIKTSVGPLPTYLDYIPHPTLFIRKVRALK